MRLLLDTHALLWFGLADSRLSPAALALIAEPTNEIIISPASYWEIAIKIRSNKYHLNQPFQLFFEQVLQAYRFSVLAIEIRHAALLTTLPLHHRDPFDRLLVAQAMAEGMPLVSADQQLDAYGVQRLW